MKVIYTFLIGMMVPYILLLGDGLLFPRMPSNINEIVFGATVYLSTPGLFLIGIVLCIRQRKLHRILGAISIIFAMSYIALVFWVFSSSDL